MPEKMKKVGLTVSILMGVTLSFCMSLIGNLTSGNGFSPILFLLSFLLSTVISLIISFLVPMKKVGDSVTKNQKPGSVTARCLESLVSDLIFTPIITLCMIAAVRAFVPKLVAMGARRTVLATGGAEAAAEAAAQAASQAAAATFPPFIFMFLKSFVICMIAGFVLIYLLQPVFLRFAMKRAGIPLGPNGMPMGGPGGPQGGPMGPGGPMGGPQGGPQGGPKPPTE